MATYDHITGPEPKRKYFLHEAAKLDPRAFVHHQSAVGGTLTVAEGGWWCYNAYIIRCTDGGTALGGGTPARTWFLRDVGRPCLLPGGTVIEFINGISGFVLLCKPELVSGNAEYVNPELLYYSRLEILRTTNAAQHISARVAGGAAIDTRVNASLPASINGSPYAMVVNVSAFDVSWVIMQSNDASHSINLTDEISDRHQIRFTTGCMLPIEFGNPWQRIQVASCNISGNGVDAQEAVLGLGEGHGSVQLVSLSSDYLSGTT